MALTVKSLKNGVIPYSGIQDLYGPVATGKATIVKNIRLVNKTGSPVTVNLYLYNASTTLTTRLLPMNLSIAAGNLVLDEQEVTMSVNDKIQADTSAASAIIKGVNPYIHSFLG